MSWVQVVLVLGPTSAAVMAYLAVLTFRQTRKVDAALGTADAMKATYAGQREFNNTLLEQNAKIRIDLEACEDGHVEDRAAIAAAQLVIDSQVREIAHLKANVNDLEQDVARHELTINQLRAGTPADRRDQ